LRFSRGFECLKRFSPAPSDNFNNRRLVGKEDVQVFLLGPGASAARILDRQDGSYAAEYNVSVEGTYTMAVSIVGKDVPGSPFLVISRYGTAPSTLAD
jgi:hypothetical protein